MLVSLTVGEREDHRHLARALAARLELRRDVSDERVDDEDETLRILERVIHPVERSGRQRPRHAGENAARVVGPRQSPEARPLGAETNLDRLEIQSRQISAALHPNPIEHRRQSERWLEHANGVRSEILALRPRRDCDEAAISMTSGDLGGDWSDGDGSPHLLHSLLVKNVEKISSQRLGAHSARIGPDDSVRSQHHAWSYSEQRRHQLLKDLVLRRGGGCADGERGRNGGGNPEADEGHFSARGGHQLYTEYIPKTRRAHEYRHSFRMDQKTRNAGVPIRV